MAALLSQGPPGDARINGAAPNDCGGLSDHAELSALWRLWNAVRGVRQMPTRRDFSPELLRPWLGNLALLDVHAEPPRFHYRLVGTHIVANLKFDPTGKAFDDIVANPAADPQTRGAYACLKTASPVFETVRPRRTIGFSFDYHRLSLPLSADGRAVTMILTGEYVTTPPVADIGRASLENAVARA